LKSDQSLPIVRALGNILEDEPPLTRTVARRILKHFQEGPRKAAEVVPPLSPRQQEVVRLVCEGWTNKEIAAKLNISSDAVKQHVGAVKRKLDVRSRTQIPGRLGRGQS
ncbi:MAG: helix-turn-helix transcriptional regulator, partial [Verrucomicrobiota bacterium]